jgi:hypothetical protein
VTVRFLIPTKHVLKGPKWPADFFAVDIANCIDETDKTDDARVDSVFEKHFGQWAPYKRSTFYDHRGRWQAASLEDKNAALLAGRTEAGRWAHFMSVDRSHRAERSCHVCHVAQRDPIYIDRASHLYILSCHLLLDSDSEDVSAISYALHNTLM